VGWGKRGRGDYVRGRVGGKRVRDTRNWKKLWGGEGGWGGVGEKGGPRLR